MGLAWDGDAGLVVIEAQAPVENAEVAEETLLEDVEDGPDALRVLLEPAEARAFVERARSWSPPGGHRARCAGSRWTRPVTSARGTTATTAAPRSVRDRSAVTEPELTPALPLSDDGSRLAVDDALHLLTRGELSIEGRLVDASNATLLLRGDRRRASAPPASTSRSRGSGRCGTSRTARWPSARSRPTRCRPRPAGDIVPPTVYRDGPAGPGMVQLWIDIDDDVDIARLHAPPRPSSSCAGSRSSTR